MKGRPRTGRKKFIESFAVSKELKDMLAGEPNKSWTISRALEDYYKKRKMRW